MKKKVRAAIACLLLMAVAFASTQGPNPPTAGANSAASGTNAWAGANQIFIADGVAANAVCTSLGNTQLLQATNFGFSIPSNATINGITVDIKRFSTNGNPKDQSILLMKAGATTGTDHANVAVVWPAGVSTFATYGSGADLWGTTWTPAQVSASNFGVQIQAQSSSINNDTAWVDYVQITITYTPGAGGSLLKWFSGNQKPITETRTTGQGL